MRIPNYSFQLIADIRTTMSMTIAGTCAIALLVSFVSLTYLQNLPSFTYGIAGGSSLGSLLIGSMIATFRAKSPSTALNEEFVYSLPQEALPIQVIAPPIEEVLAKANRVSLNPNVRKSFPPSEAWPFITTEFELSFAVREEKFTYVLPIAQFHEKKGIVYAYFIHNDTILNIPIHNVEGPEFSTEHFSWTLNVRAEKSLPNVDYLNKKIQLKNYFSFYSAWYHLGCYLQNKQIAHYFLFSSNTCEYVFEIPGLKSVTYENNLVTFTRDVTQSLILPDQIELLKKSAIEWQSEIGYQLDNPDWSYDFQTPIFSVKSNNNTVIVSISKTK